MKNIPLLLCMTVMVQPFVPLPYYHHAAVSTQLSLLRNHKNRDGSHNRKRHSYLEDPLHPSKFKTVSIILFHPGTPQEGVHTVDLPDNDKVVLAFESPQACRDFCTRLQKQRFFEPHPCVVALATLERQSRHWGVRLQLVPRQVHLAPPTRNAEHLQHDPLLEQRRKLSSVYAMEGENVFDTTAGAWE
jgi:hypothetical protein